MYVIAGVSGHTGSAAAETLLARGEPIRVVVRDPAKGTTWKQRGADVSVADLGDASAMTKALAGADGAYLLVPPQYAAEDLIAAQKPVADALAAAVRQSGIPHVVFLSSIGAQHATGTGPIRSLHYSEGVIGRAAPNVTIIRASYFLENAAPVLGDAKAQGVLPSFLTPGRAVPMVATKDIGRAAADALLDPPKGRRIIELSGPRDLTPEDVAAGIGKVLGREVRVQGVPLEAVVPALTAAGFTAGAAALMQEMYGAVNSGRIDFEGGAAIRKRGTLGPEDALRPLL
jgi:uncharacterized protein YbjT (DUF2867 family)